MRDEKQKVCPIHGTPLQAEGKCFFCTHGGSPDYAADVTGYQERAAPRAEEPPRGDPHPLDVIALARTAARRHGYALAMHGSLSRDVDLVAVPWKEDAAEPAVLAEAVRAAVGGWIFAAEPDGREGYYGIDDSSKHSPVERPHGRLAWSIYGVLGSAYIDLSVMPLRRSSADAAPRGEQGDERHDGNGPPAAFCGKPGADLGCGLGCQAPIRLPEHVYRCTDCGLPFHRECAVQHFEFHAAVMRGKARADAASATKELLRLLTDDAYAMTFQTLGPKHKYWTTTGTRRDRAEEPPRGDPLLVRLDSRGRGPVPPDHVLRDIWFDGLALRKVAAEVSRVWQAGIAQPGALERSMRALEEHLRSSSAATEPTADHIAWDIVQRVAELPDRTSPDDWPEAMLVTSEELAEIVVAALGSAPAQRQPERSEPA